MPRDFICNGEALISVRGGAHMGSGAIGVYSELGLTTDQIRIVPRFYQRALYVDDFGPDCPVEVMAGIASVDFRLNLIHYDPNVLDIMMRESMAGGGNVGFNPNAGTFAPWGTPMGAGLPLFASGNHYFGVNIASPVLQFPWRFFNCYLPEQPVEIPLGTEKSITSCNVRAIPYSSPLGPNGVISLSSGGILVDGALYGPQEIKSANYRLWDHLSFGF